MAAGRGRVARYAGLAGILLAGTANSQDLDPRRYVNLPVGQNFLAGIYTYSEGCASAYGFPAKRHYRRRRKHVSQGIRKRWRTLAEYWCLVHVFDFTEVGLQRSH